MTAKKRTKKQRNKEEEEERKKKKKEGTEKERKKRKEKWWITSIKSKVGFLGPGCGVCPASVEKAVPDSDSDLQAGVITSKLSGRV